MKFQKGQSGNPTGRPRKSDQNAGAVARAEKQIRDRLPEIVDAMIALSLGVKCTDLNIITGQTTVYDKPPDRSAGQYLIDRIMGKPTERQEVEHSGKIDVSKLSDDELQSITEA